jgi:hypothetical protein
MTSTYTSCCRVLHLKQKVNTFSIIRHTPEDGTCIGLMLKCIVWSVQTEICRSGQNTWNLLPCCMIYRFISIITIILFKILRTELSLHVKFVAYKLEVLYHNHAWTSWLTASLCTYYVCNLYGLSLYQLPTPNSNDTLTVTIKMKSKKIFARSPSFYFTIHKNILIS